MSGFVLRGNNTILADEFRFSLRDVHEEKSRIHPMLRCQRLDLGCHRRSRPSIGRAKVTAATSPFCLYRLGRGNKVSVRKRWWQVGEHAKTKVQQSHQILLSKSFTALLSQVEGGRAFESFFLPFQPSFYPPVAMLLTAI